MPGKLFLDELVKDARKLQSELQDASHRCEVIIQNKIADNVISLDTEDE